MNPVTVVDVRRYPVKSMLGEQRPQLACTLAGLVGDRALAVVDDETGHVASAKQPRRWRTLLSCRASLDGSAVHITLPGGRVLTAGDPVDADIHRTLSEFLGRPVHLTAHREAGAALERADPEDILTHGITADVPFRVGQIGQGSPGTTFVDYAPIQLITLATLDRLGTVADRMRPNVVLGTTGTNADNAYGEDAWLGRDLQVGDVCLRVQLPTPRCAIPTLEHGDLPRAPGILRTLLREHRVDVAGLGVLLPCAGAYATVVKPGTLRVGDTVHVAG
jgi:uncharacterized protein